VCRGERHRVELARRLWGVCARFAATGVGASRWFPREGIRESSGARGGQKGAAGRENVDGGGCYKDRMEDW
jgi:hypothetical protein